MTWRVAKSLNVLLAQLNALAPNRSKVSDGSIGDTDHQNRTSDHNPWCGPGVVTARDFTHDPGGGLSCHFVADTLTLYQDPRIKYIIWDKGIWTPGIGWRLYSGPNPHTSHLHLSVVCGNLMDNEESWSGFAVSKPEPPKEEDMSSLKFDKLVKTAAGSAIWWSSNNTRSWIQTEATWRNVAYRIREAGGNPSDSKTNTEALPAKVVDDLDAFGVVIGPKPE